MRLNRHHFPRFGYFSLVSIFTGHDHLSLLKIRTRNLKHSLAFRIQCRRSTLKYNRRPAAPVLNLILLLDVILFFSLVWLRCPRDQNITMLGRSSNGYYHLHPVIRWSSWHTIHSKSTPESNISTSSCGSLIVSCPISVLQKIVHSQSGTHCLDQCPSSYLRDSPCFCPYISTQKDEHIWVGACSYISRSIPYASSQPVKPLAASHGAVCKANFDSPQSRPFA